MYKEIFIALCLVAAVMAYPSAENEQEQQQQVETVQIEGDDEQQGDLEGSESRYFGGYGRGWGHGYGGYGGWRGYGHGHRYWG